MNRLGRTVQNRQNGQTGTEADSHRHLTGSVTDRTAQSTGNKGISFALAYPHTTDEPAATDPAQLACVVPFCGTASTAERPSVSVQISPPVLGAVSRPSSTGLR